MTQEKHDELMLKYLDKFFSALVKYNVPIIDDIAVDLGNIIRECIDDSIIYEYPYQVVMPTDILDVTVLNGKKYYHTEGYAGFTKEVDRDKFFTSLFKTAEDGVPYTTSNNGIIDFDLLELYDDF